MFDAVWTLTLNDESSIQGILGIFKNEDAARTAMIQAAAEYGFDGEQDDTSIEVSNTEYLRIDQFSVKG